MFWRLPDSSAPSIAPHQGHGKRRGAVEFIFRVYAMATLLGLRLLFSVTSPLDEPPQKTIAQPSVVFETKLYHSPVCLWPMIMV